MRFNPVLFLRRPRRLLQRPLNKLALVLGLCLCATQITAEGVIFREYDIKAAYLYNFIKYVEWPSQGLPDRSETITIGLLGENPFGPVIHSLNGKMAKGGKVTVKENVSLAELTSCQVVFVGPSEKDRMPEILDQLKNIKVLTVSEIEGFAARGGMINFVPEKNKVRFEINADAARRTGFSISSELMKLARVVKP